MKCRPPQISQVLVKSAGRFLVFRHAGSARRLPRLAVPSSLNPSLSTKLTDSLFQKPLHNSAPAWFTCPWLVPTTKPPPRKGSSQAFTTRTNFTNRQSVPDHQITIAVRILDPYLAPPSLPVPAVP